MGEAERLQTVAQPWRETRRRLDITGLLLEVRRFSVSDGPGVRSTVVMKGCPLRCAWCEQPHSQQLRPELSLEDDLKRALADELATAGDLCRDPNGPKGAACAQCLRCLKPADDDLLRTVGRRWTVQSALDVLERDERLYQCSGGGITVSGGEPLYQSEFTISLLEAARVRGWHTALETSGQASTSVFEEALEYCDLVLFDLKETDLHLHQVWTGVSLEPIIRNLVRAAVSGVDLWVRLPVVPGANDRDDHWEQVGDLLADLPGPPPVQLAPYSPEGALERRAPRRFDAWHEPTDERLHEIAGILGRYHLDVHLA